MLDNKTIEFQIQSFKFEYLFLGRWIIVDNLPKKIIIDVNKCITTSANKRPKTAIS